MKRVAVTVCLALLLVGATPVQASEPEQACTEADPCEDETCTDANPCNDGATETSSSGGPGEEKCDPVGWRLFMGLVIPDVDPDGCYMKKIERLYVQVKDHLPPGII